MQQQLINECNPIPYSQIPNDLLRRTDMSFKAKGFLSMILSLPNNWKLTKQSIVEQFSIGREAVDSLFRELESFGYMKIVPERNKDGKFIGNTYYYSNYPKYTQQETEIKYFKNLQQELYNRQENMPLSAKPLADNPSLRIKSNKEEREKENNYAIANEDTSSDIKTEKESDSVYPNLQSKYYAIVQMFYGLNQDMLRDKKMDFVCAKRVYEKLSDYLKNDDIDVILHYFNKLLNEVNNTFLGKQVYTFSSITAHNNLSLLIQSVNKQVTQPTVNGKPVVKPIIKLTDEDLWKLTREDGRRLYPNDIMYFNQIKRKYEQKIGIRDAKWGDLEPNWRSKFPNYPDNPPN